MAKVKKTSGRLLIFIMILSMILPNILMGQFSIVSASSAASPLTPTTPQPMRDMTGTEFVAQMGVGWNLGNAFDSQGFDYGSDKQLAGLDETSWGSPIITKSMIDAVAAAGFKTLRIPIT